MDVAIVTPKYDGREHADHARSIRVAEGYLRSKGLSVVVLDASGCAVLPRVRNQLVAEALSRGAKKILMVDSDIGFDPVMAERIVSSPHPLVGAAPQAQLKSWRGAGAPRLVWMPFAGEETAFDDDGYASVRGLATGFLCVEAVVFKALRERGLAKPYIYPGTNPKAWPFLASYFAYGYAPLDLESEPGLKAQLDEQNIPEDQRVFDVGEDYWFCDLARKAGFACMLDAHLRVRHWEGRSVHDFSLMEMIQSNGAEP